MPLTGRGGPQHPADCLTRTLTMPRPHVQWRGEAAAGSTTAALRQADCRAGTSCHRTVVKHQHLLPLVREEEEEAWGCCEWAGAARACQQRPRAAAAAAGARPVLSQAPGWCPIVLVWWHQRHRLHSTRTN